MGVIRIPFAAAGVLGQFGCVRYASQTAGRRYSNLLYRARFARDGQADESAPQLHVLSGSSSHARSKRRRVAGGRAMYLVPPPCHAGVGSGTALVALSRRRAARAYSQPLRTLPGPADAACDVQQAAAVQVSAHAAQSTADVGSSRRVMGGPAAASLTEQLYLCMPNQHTCCVHDAFADHRRPPHPPGCISLRA